MQFLDTQVLVYALNGTLGVPIEGNAISSVVAGEFLLQLGGDPKQANYYILPKSRWPGARHYYPRVVTAWSPARRKQVTKRLTDKVIMDFGREYGTIIQYSNIAWTDVINSRESHALQVAIAGLDKGDQRLVKSRFEFLLHNGIVCEPLNTPAVETGYELLDEFTRSHNLKADFRNSWNDILIYATAIAASSSLLTLDNELSRFIVERRAESYNEVQPGVSRLNFPRIAEPARRQSKESKGYVNRGWRVIFRR